MADFPPTHPGDVLREDFLKPMGMTQYALAKAIDVPQIRISGIVNARRAVTPDTALRLARYFGTSAEFWVGMQATYDLETARDRLQSQILSTVRPRAEGVGPAGRGRHSELAEWMRGQGIDPKSGRARLRRMGIERRLSDEAMAALRPLARGRTRRTSSAVSGASRGR